MYCKYFPQSVAFFSHFSLVSFYFILTFLLSHNLYAANLKCSVSFDSCICYVAKTQNKIWNMSIFSENSFVPLSSIVPVPSPEATTFWLVTIVLPILLHTNGILQCIFVCLSSFTQDKCFCESSMFFCIPLILLLSSMALCEYTTICSFSWWWILGLFPVLCYHK